jgi:iron complex outermembrane receptor protein
MTRCWGDLTSITSYFSRDATTTVDVTRIFGALSAGYGNPLGAVYPSSYADAGTQPNETAQQIFTQEIRVVSPDPTARLTWVGGLFYSRRQQHESSYSYSPVVAGELGEPADESLLSLGTKAIDTQTAAFGQIDYRILDGLKVTAGVRAAETKETFITASGGIFNAGVPALVGDSASQKPVTPKFGISYQADPQDLYYLSIAKGYRVGGVNSALPDYCGATAPTSYDPDYVWSYEVGAKNRLLDNRLQVSSSVFHLDWKNIQNHMLLPCGFGYLANTGNATSNGFDVAADALVTEALKVSFAAAYTDAKLSNTVTLGGVPVVEKGDAIGTVPDVAAPWNLTLSARYDLPPSGSVSSYLWLEDIYHSANPGPFSSQIANSPYYAPLWTADPATNLLNGRIGAIKGSLEVSLFVNNLLNSHPQLDKYTDTQTSTLVDYLTFRPRTVGLNADFHF